MKKKSRCFIDSFFCIVIFELLLCLVCAVAVSVEEATNLLRGSLFKLILLLDNLGDVREAINL